MKLSVRERKGKASATMLATLGLMLGCCAVLALLGLTAAASQPGWWTSRDAVDPTLGTNDYAAVNQGQLKQFTARAVDELNADLTGGAGPDLTNLVYGWQQDYLTNGYATNTANPAKPYKPSDFDAMTVGQLKYIASLIYSPLAGAGYTGLTPSWIVQNTNTDNVAANVGQLKQVFAWDIAVAPATPTGLAAVASNPGEIDLTWTPPVMNNATFITIEESTDGGSTWSTVETLDDPTLQSYALTGLPQGSSGRFRVSYGGPAGASAPSTPTADVQAPVAPRYVVIDLGPNFVPTGLNSSGVVVGNGTNGYGAQVWGQGVLSPLSTNYSGWTKFSAVGIDDAEQIAGNMWHTSPVPTNSVVNTGCYWANTNAATAPIPLGATGYAPGGPPNNAQVTAMSGGGFMVGYVDQFFYDAVQFNPAWTDYSTNYWNGTNWQLPCNDPAAKGSFPIAAAGATNWCGNANGFHAGPPVINGTTYTNSAYTSIATYGINSSNWVVGAQGGNALLITNASGGTLMTNNLGPGLAVALNDATTTNVVSGTNVVTATPQIVGVDGTGTNAMLWDQTMYDGTPTTNTYIAKNLNLLTVGATASGTNAPSVHIKSAFGINLGGLIPVLIVTATGSTDGGVLLPMQFRVDALSTGGAIQADSDSTFESYQTQPATTLKVAKWNDAFTNNDSAPALTSTFIDTDVDAVYVRISDGSRKGAGTLTGKLQISSVDSTGATIDSGNTVDLIEDPLNPGVFQTKALLLVSDETDRTYTATGFPAAGANNHRLFKTPLGSTLVATYTMAPGTTAVQKMVVAPQKTIKVHAFILVQGLVFLTPVTTVANVQAQLNVAQQRWAQCGIQVDYTIDSEASDPAGVSPASDEVSGFDGFYPSGSTIAFPDECKALFKGLPGAPGEICIYYVGSIAHWNSGGINLGDQAYSSVPKIMSSANVASGYGNRILVNVGSVSTSPFTESHELIHVLCDAVHSSDHSTPSPDYPTEWDDLTMLWYGPTSSSNTVTATKRISAQQAKDALTKTSFPK